MADPGVFKTVAVIVAAAGVAVVGTSHAATLGSVNSQTLGVGGAGSGNLCSAGSIGVTTRVGYRSSRYEIYQLSFTGIPAGCQGKSFTATFADSGTNASLGSTSGTLPAAATGTSAVTSGTNPNVDNVASTIKVVLYAAG
ncbi:MAG: hypothetical protein U0R64_04340 [Candidatus Nanopelagicales bacterium]